MKLTELRPSLEDMVKLLSVERSGSETDTLELVPSEWLKGQDIESVSLKFDRYIWSYKKALIFPAVIEGKKCEDRGFVLYWSENIPDGNYVPLIVFDYNLPKINEERSSYTNEELITVKDRYNLPLEVYFTSVFGDPERLQGVYFTSVFDNLERLKGHIVLFRNPSTRVGTYYYFSPEVVLLGKAKYSDPSLISKSF